MTWHDQRSGHHLTRSQALVGWRQHAGEKGRVVSHPGSGLLRISRGIVLAVCCAMLALGGHVLGGAGIPPVSAWAGVAILCAAGFAVLADRERSFRNILAVTLLAQVAFHVAFSLVEPAGVAHHATGSTGPGVSMTVGHLAAAVATAWLASRGEAVLWALADLFRFVRIPTLAVVPPPTPPSLAAAQIQAVPVPDLLTRRVHPRRGPPREKSTS